MEWDGMNDAMRTEVRGALQEMTSDAVSLVRLLTAQVEPDMLLYAVSAIEEMATESAYKVRWREAVTVLGVAVDGGAEHPTSPQTQPDPTSRHPTANPAIFH